MTDKNEIIETLRTNAQEELALCDLYIERNTRCLRSHQWVVRSNLWVRRIVFRHESNCMALGPQKMPTLFTKEDAEALVKDFNDGFKKEGKDETVYLIHDTEYWQSRRAEAVMNLDTAARLSLEAA